MMYDMNDLVSFVLSEVTSNHEEYLEDEEKFIKNSIEEFTDSSDAQGINHLYQEIIDDLNYAIDD